MAIAIHAKNIVKRFKKNKKIITALKGIDIDIYEGEIYGLLGPNGSGKSTFIRIASTLLFPDEGEIEIFDHDVKKHQKYVQEIMNRVSVEASFFRKLSAYENLFYSAGIHGISKKEALNKIENLIDKVGLDRKRLKDPLEDFSRGMQQKVAIARAFITDPKILLLDEPTTGLDPRAKKDVQKLILDLRARTKATILLTTHDMSEAEKLCDRVSIIHNGRIMITGNPQELKRKLVSKISNPTFEDVFIEFTGLSFEDAEYGKSSREVVSA